MCGIETMAEKEGGGGAHIYERNSKKAGTPSLIKEGHLVSWILPYFVTFFFFFSSAFFPFPLGKCVNVTNVHCPGGGGEGAEKGRRVVVVRGAWERGMPRRQLIRKYHTIRVLLVPPTSCPSHWRSEEGHRGLPYVQVS